MSLKAQDVYGILNSRIGESGGGSGTPTVSKETIKAAPVTVETTSSETLASALYKVNILDLQLNVPYMVSPNDYAVLEHDNIINMLRFIVLCEDGTEKTIVNTTKLSSIFCVVKFINSSSLSLYLIESNNYYIIRLNGATTSSDVSVEVVYNYKYLGISNTHEYTPTDDYNPATKKYVDDTINNEILLNQTIKVAPVTIQTTSNDTLVRNTYKVNILDLEFNRLYMINPNILLEDVDDKINMNNIYFIVLCTDGTEKTVVVGNVYNIFRVVKSGSNIILRFYDSNYSYTIILNGSATASDINVELNNNLNYLNVDNDFEYTPTGDYNPATKKYVDDSVNNIDGTKVNTSQGIKNAGKVLGINEEGNVVPVDASSGSGSGSIFNESIVVNEDGEIEVITTIPTIYVNMETANLETDSNVFSVDKNGYLISSK